MPLELPRPRLRLSPPPISAKKATAGNLEESAHLEGMGEDVLGAPEGGADCIDG